jgi:hypothetical protein
MLDGLKRRLVEIREAPRRVAAAAAPRVEAQYRRDATTRRGNIPSFEPGGPNIPITATPSADAITVRAVDWSMRIAIFKRQPDGWIGIVAEEARRLGGGA